MFSRLLISIGSQLGISVLIQNVNYYSLHSTSPRLGVVGCIHKGESRHSDGMMFMVAFVPVVMTILVVMATFAIWKVLFCNHLRSGNVERNPGPTVIGKRLHSSFYRRSHVINSRTTTCIMNAPRCKTLGVFR